MKIKKRYISVLGVIILTVISALVFCSYIATRDFGVAYPGYAGLHYNWHYFFASCPKKEYKFENSEFKFTYLTSGENKNPVKEYGNFITAYRLSGIIIPVCKSKSNDCSPTIKKIKPKLRDYLKNDSYRLWNTKDELKNWMIFLGLDSKYRGTSSRMGNSFYHILSLKRIILKNNIPAVLIEAKTLYSFKPNYRFLVGIAPNGKVFEISNTSRPPATEERYFSTAFIYSRGLIMRPDAEGDKTSDCVFEKLLETLEFKNTESKK